MGLRDFLRVTPALIGWLVSFLFWGGAIVNAAEIKVVSGSAVAPVMIELIARFEKSSGHRVSFDFRRRDRRDNRSPVER
jgi:ABC-type molybdate transport system substrate-binding protein